MTSRSTQPIRAAFSFTHFIQSGEGPLTTAVMVMMVVVVVVVVMMIMMYFVDVAIVRWSTIGAMIGELCRWIINIITVVVVIVVIIIIIIAANVSLTPRPLMVSD